MVGKSRVTVWIRDDAIATWNSTTPTGRKGRTKTYSDLAIETALTLRCLLKLPLRQTQGFLEGLIKLLGLKIDAPCYSTLSRRADSLSIDLGVLAGKSDVHVAIDATGLKVFGEGEWKMRTHGKDKRRTWRKLHIAIDHKTHEIIAVTLTESNVHDSMETNSLLSQMNKVKSVTGDKGYDNKHAYEPIAARGDIAIIPPRSGAALKLKNPTWGDVERNRLIREKHLLGKDAWKSGSGYRRRVLVETSIDRYKRTLGASMHSRRLSRQKTEVRLGAKILNRMTHLGMPKSYKV
jgi:hypothetical protein